MKSAFLKSLLLVSVAAPTAFAFDLYETAPSVGMPESHAIRYSANVSVGYDDNLNSSDNNEQDGFFTQFGVGASYADHEAATQISYSVNLGGRLYDDASEATDRRFVSISSLTASLSHSFSPSSVYTTSLNMSYTMEPNIASGISSNYDQGEYFNWAWSHAYSQAIDARWSWTINGSYSGMVYTEEPYDDDNRQYLTAGLTLSYRYSSLTTYSVGTSYHHDIRKEGENSDNIYFNLSASHSLSPLSSVYASVGVQCKMIADESDLYPTFRAGYRRQITDGLSANLYVSLDNENIDTGRAANDIYLSDQTVRAGADLSYAWTHKVTFYVDASLLYRDYSDHTGGAADKSDTTWVIGMGMRYKFTEHLTGTIDYKYTSAEREVGGDYDRNRISTGLSYTF